MSDNLQQTQAGDTADVIIIGGGPVGMGLAIELGQRGKTCIVVERSCQLHHIPKGQNLTQRSGEHFKCWGVSGAIRDASPIPHDYGSAGVTAYGTLLSGYDYDWFRRAQVGKYYAAANERLPQYATEAVLRARVAELDTVKTRFGWSATGIDQDADGVAVVCAKGPDGEHRTLRGRFAVGCDGARSCIRRAIGFEQDIDPHDRRMVLLVFRSTELHDLLKRFAGKSYFNVLKPELEGYWQFLGRVDLRQTWFFHCPVPADTTLVSFDFAALLHGTVGANFAIEFDHIGFWDLTIAVAKSYRRGRVFIAGDAAHSHPPYGGFGINTGFEDVRNLGWKLAAQLEGWAGPALIDSYSAERQLVFVSTARDFIGRMITDDREFVSRFNPDTDKAAFEAQWRKRSSGGNADVTGFAPNYAGSPIVPGTSGIPSARGIHEFKARAGHHLAPQTLSTGTTVFDALGPGFTLLAFEADPGAVRAFKHAAKQKGIPLKIVTDDRGEAHKNYEAQLILIRPDHFVAWAGKTPPENAGKILTAAVGH